MVEELRSVASELEDRLLGDSNKEQDFKISVAKAHDGVCIGISKDAHAAIGSPKQVSVQRIGKRLYIEACDENFGYVVVVREDDVEINLSRSVGELMRLPSGNYPAYHEANTIVAEIP